MGSLEAQSLGRLLGFGLSRQAGKLLVSGGWDVSLYSCPYCFPFARWVSLGCNDAFVLRAQLDLGWGGFSLQYLQMLWLTSCLESPSLQPSLGLCLQLYQNHPTTATPGPPGPLARLS